MGGATILRIGVYNNVCTCTCDILRYINLIANEVKKIKKNCQINLFGGKKAVWGQLLPVLTPSYVPGSSLL